MSSTDPKLFGFAEFLSGLALMVLAWTIADVRYRFRIRTAPLPLQGITFFGMTALGVLALATDLWRAQEWFVPVGPLNPTIWQALMGVLFLLTFLLWAWFAFIKPPVYGRLNSQRFARVLYRAILNGSQEELAVVADELTHSVDKLIHFGREERERYPNSPAPPKLKKVEEFANAILLLIADARFCRAIVAYSPRTALAIFEDVAKTKKYRLPIETFAKNIVLEAIGNKDSFLYHEESGYKSGLLGYHKPLTSVMFGNAEMAENISTLLDPDGVKMMDWDYKQWEAYCRIVLLTLEDFISKGYQRQAFVFFRAKGHLEYALGDLYRLDGVEAVGRNDEPSCKLRAIVDFIKDAIRLLDKKPIPKGIRLKRSEHQDLDTIYDMIAGLMFEVIYSASTVTSPRGTCWRIQHNSVWTDLFCSARESGEATQIIHFKFRRLVYDEITRMNDFVNFKGAKILGYCLNVMGLEAKRERLHSNLALHKAVLAWTKKYYAWVYSENPAVAEACLMAGWTYDKRNLRLVLTYPAEGLRRKPGRFYFSVDQVQKP
ncbi:hypothetical protein EZJ49_06650 [Bdellovibrio bacteriovorus]|uniref:hypothetical protein n=1 Tax=Bdellovibrio bacteriovorus TaxID=959 RepID=UPI0021D35DF2|nr:hypothetical protein [Bdellovibrio bacteriovorus]UXR65924.1 hypothetical protein EZJ49_06650 [Bdellovibrio bacteriovorus]